MNKLELGLLTILFLTPLTTFGHGQEALVPFITIEVIRLIGLVVFMVLTDLNAKGKLILVAIYILSLFLAYQLVGHLPLRKYGTIINTVLLLIPIVLITFGYWGLRKYFKKRTN